MDQDPKSTGTAAIEHRSFARIGFLGNPSDVYFGRTISFTIGNFWASVKLEPSEHLIIKPHPFHDLVQFTSLDHLLNRLENEGYYGGVRLLMAICKVFRNYCKDNAIHLHQHNFTLSYNTNIPRQTGLSGSSAIVSAALSCLLDFYNVRHLIKLQVRPNLVLNAEKELGIVAGLQDRVAQVYGGLVHMGPELLNKYVGESELGIRTLFQRARTSSPCVLFFDEVDALTTSRDREGGWVVGSLLNQFLTELDGGERRNVYVIGATNRPDVIDSAFLRPGRFGNLVYVPLPNADERVLILKSIGKKRPIDPSVDLDATAKKCEGFSGADLANLMDKAIHVAVKEKFESSEDEDIDLSDCTIKMTHFEQALSLVTPSVSKQQIKHYEELPKKLQRSMGSNKVEQINVGSS